MSTSLFLRRILIPRIHSLALSLTITLLLMPLAAPPHASASPACSDTVPVTSGFYTAVGTLYVAAAALQRGKFDDARQMLDRFEAIVIQPTKASLAAMSRLKATNAVTTAAFKAALADADARLATHEKQGWVLPGSSQLLLWREIRQIGEKGIPDLLSLCSIALEALSAAANQLATHADKAQPMGKPELWRLNGALLRSIATATYISVLVPD